MTTPTQTDTLSLHAALPISFTPDALARKVRAVLDSRAEGELDQPAPPQETGAGWSSSPSALESNTRSEEHTSELQSHSDIVCRLLLEKKKTILYTTCRSREV